MKPPFHPMPRNSTDSLLAPAIFYGLLSALLVPLSAGCTEYPFLPFWNGTGGGDNSGSVVSAGAVSTGNPFHEDLIQARTFTHGTSVRTITYRSDDMTRKPLGIDFNGDGKIDPVVAYGDQQAVIQILLSQGAPGVVNHISLTLDSKRDMEDLADVAVGDIDGDGALDIVAGAKGAVWYFHHPTGLPTTELKSWGNPDPTDELRERIDASNAQLTNDELQAIITQALGPGVNLDDYIVTIEQLYANVVIGDFDKDGDNDVAASRKFKINLEPRPEVPVDPIEIDDGDVLIFVNPGFAANGHGWLAVSIGKHERQQRLDRDGASGLLAHDLDGDGDLDLISSARDDNNAQVEWFENPGSALTPDVIWTPWRIGSVRDAWTIDVGDLTGDGRPDIVAAGGAQQQLMLFIQPAEGPKRTYDWDSAPIVTFQTFEPRDVKILDIDNDGVPELVVGGTTGAVRYFERPVDPRATWTAVMLLNFDPPGDVGLLGYGDLDADGDFDLIAVVSAEKDNDAHISWIRNDLILINSLGTRR